MALGESSVAVVRALSTGVVIDDVGGQVRVRKGKALPPGILVVRQGEATIDIVELSETDSPVNKIVDVLKRREHGTDA